MEEQAAEGLTSQVELSVPASALVGDYIIVRVTKMWSDVRWRKDTDDFKMGLVIEEPFNTELLVAIPIVPDPTPLDIEGIVLWEDFVNTVRQPIELYESVRDKSIKGF